MTLTETTRTTVEVNREVWGYLKGKATAKGLSVAKVLEMEVTRSISLSGEVRRLVQKALSHLEPAPGSLQVRQTLENTMRLLEEA